MHLPKTASSQAKCYPNNYLLDDTWPFQGGMGNSASHFTCLAKVYKSATIVFLFLAHTNEMNNVVHSNPQTSTKAKKT
uniref:Cytochrome c oxidase polypeptide Vc n=1 Tax=Rhizophora mucronata TaxID=61149 RepID=A0A2P2JUC1_RHIMU